MIGTSFSRPWPYGTAVSALSAYLPLTSLLRSLVRLQFQTLRGAMTRTWRNSAGKYNWYEFSHTLAEAAALAHDMGLSAEQVIL